MSDSFDELNSQIAQELAVLRNVPARDPDAARRGRASFLAEAKSIQQAVSSRPNMRHNKHNTNNILSFLLGRNPSVFTFSPILSVVLLVGLVLAGAGTTVYAAQSSQPDQFLYPLKLWSEDVQLQWTGDAAARIQLYQVFADRRVAEIAWMTQSGKDVSEVVTNRLNALTDDALSLVTTLDQDHQKTALKNLKNSFTNQQAQLETLKAKASPQLAGQFSSVVAMLDTHAQLAEEGIQDPEALRKYYRETAQPGQPTQKRPSRTPELTSIPDPSDTPGLTATPTDKGKKDTIEPQVTHTPKPPVDTPDNKPPTKTLKPPVDTPDTKPPTKTPKPAVDTPEVKPTKPPADTPVPKPTKPPADTPEPKPTKDKK